MARFTDPVTAKWTALEQALGEVLCEIASPAATFCGPYTEIPGIPESGFKSDGLLATDKRLLAVEVECKQSHPDSNVSKYWMLHARHRAYERIEVVHVFTPAYTSYPWRMKLAAFIGEQCAARIPLRYWQLDLRAATDYAESLATVRTLLVERAIELGLAKDSLVSASKPAS